MSITHAYRRPYDARVRRGLPLRFISAPVAVTYVAIGGLFLFTGVNWHDDLEFFLETSVRATTGTANVRLFDVTADAPVASSRVSTTSTTLTRLRSPALTLANGNVYQIQVGVLSGDAGAVMSAKLIVT